MSMPNAPGELQLLARELIARSNFASKTSKESFILFFEGHKGTIVRAKIDQPLNEIPRSLQSHQR